MEKNNLDNFYKEKFKDFGAEPDDTVWERIEASLEAKRKKRAIPIWWQLGGVAAVLAVILYITNPFGTTDGLDANPKLVDTEHTDDTEKITGSKTEETLEKADDIEVTEIDANGQDNGSSNSLDSPKTEKQKVEKERIINSPVFKKNQQKDGLVNGKQKGKQQNRAYKTPTEIAANSTKSKQKIANKGRISHQDEETKTLAVQIPKKDGIAQNDNLNTVLDEVEVAQAKNNAKNQLPPALTAKDSINQKTEDTAVAEQAENGKKSIYEAIEDQQKNDIALVVENETGKWSMGAAFAPVYYGSTGEGSPIHSNFATNDKSGNINLSYGLQVSYNVGKKLSIRSGVHRVDFGYDTNEIEFSSSLESSTNALINNIDYRTTARNLVVRSKPLANDGLSSVESTEIFAENPSRDGRMVQQLGYIEVPFELNYALIDTKLGVNVIGGFSSLFLVDNAVSLEDTNAIMEMGNANNVNNLNFSTNIGLGIRYRLTQNMQFNLEPIFKYQLNTFSETAGNFNPYSIGVYSGINFRF